MTALLARVLVALAAVGCGSSPPEQPQTPAPVEAPAPPAEPNPASAAPPARCVISTRGDRYEGPCRFLLGSGGSFAVQRVDSEAPLIAEVTSISVTLIEPGVAEVRGLTTAGINSRWGAARRSKDDGACWKGTDFSVCAY